MANHYYRSERADGIYGPCDVQYTRWSNDSTISISSDKEKLCQFILNRTGSNYPSKLWVQKDTQPYEILKQMVDKTIPLDSYLFITVRTRYKDAPRNVELKELDNTVRCTQLLALYNYDKKEIIQVPSSCTLAKNFQYNRELIEGSDGDALATFSISDAPVATAIVKKGDFDSASQLLTMYFSTKSMLEKRNVQASEEMVQKISKDLLKVADALQLEFTENKAVNRGDYTHAKARYVLFSIEQYDLPICVQCIEDQNIYNIWITNLFNYGKKAIEFAYTVQ